MAQTYRRTTNQRMGQVRVTLRKNLTVDDVDLNKGDEGWVRGFRFGDKEVYIVDVGEHKMLRIERGALDFPKREVKVVA